MCADNADDEAPGSLKLRFFADKVDASKGAVTAPVTAFEVIDVTSKDEFRACVSTLKQIFTDPTDLETDTTLIRLFRSPALASYFLLRDGDRNPIGVQLIRTNPHVPHAMYIPYGGLLPTYRGLGVYPKMAKLTAKRMLARGPKYSLNDVEDPRRIRGVYPDEDQEEVIQRSKRRIRFFKRSLGMYFVNDEEIPYCRPASNDPQNIQAYDLLGFRPLNTTDPLWTTVFNEDKTAIRTDAYARMYLELMQIEYGTKHHAPSAQELREKFPAIATFWKALETSQKSWVSLDQS